MALEAFRGGGGASSAGKIFPKRIQSNTVEYVRHIINFEIQNAPAQQASHGKKPKDHTQQHPTSSASKVMSMAGGFPNSSSSF